MGNRQGIIQIASPACLPGPVLLPSKRKRYGIQHEDVPSQTGKPFMRFGIVVNPAAGRHSLKRKREAIARCAAILGNDTLVEGWQTTSPESLARCARDLAVEVDVLVVAGGDGTLSDVINAVGDEKVLGYLPFGSGNAWRSTLGLPRSPEKVAVQIRDGVEHSIDLVQCEGIRKGILASVGIEGFALSEREKYLQRGVTGFDAYFRATTKSLLKGYSIGTAIVTIDGKPFEVANMLSLVVTKTPFYGYGFKVVPGAKLTDGLLHVLLVSGETPTAISAIVTSLLGGNRIGQYFTCKEVSIATGESAYLQVDGSLQRRGTHFSFKVLPNALTLRY